MIKVKLKKGPGLMLAAGVLAALAVGVAELYLWKLCGYAPLLALALLQLLPAVCCALLLLPVGREFALQPKPEPKETGESKKTLKRRLLARLTDVPRLLRNGLARLANYWHCKKNGIMGLLLLAVVVVCNILFWPNVKRTSDAARLAYYLPVMLAVLFVVSVALEKWLAAMKETHSENSRLCAVMENLRSALALCRIAQVLTVLTMLLRLIGIYDAQMILQIALLVLFLYETVMLVLSVAIRLIRKELFAVPALPLSPKAMGSSGVLTYLEENTGITMRSLWSMWLIRQLLPGILLFVVLLTWLSTGIIQVESHQEGALYRLGKLQDESLKPGLHLTLPWPFDKVEIYDTQSLRRVVVGYVPGDEENKDNTWTEGHGVEEYRLLLKEGTEMVSINLVVEYRVSDLPQYVRKSANADALLQAAAYEIVTERTIVTDLDTLLAEDRTVFSQTFREELSQRMKDMELGVEVVDVVLESIHPPVEVANIFQRLVTVQLQARQLILEAETEAILVEAAAMQQKRAVISVAQTIRYQTEAKARGEVTEFMAAVAAYSAYPGAYVYYKYMNALTQAYQKGVVIIVGDGVDSGGLIIGNLSRPVEEDPYYIEPEVEEEYYE